MHEIYKRAVLVTLSFIMLISCFLQPIRAYHILPLAVVVPVAVTVAGYGLASYAKRRVFASMMRGKRVSPGLPETKVIDAHGNLQTISYQDALKEKKVHLVFAHGLCAGKEHYRGYVKGGCSSLDRYLFDGDDYSFTSFDFQEMMQTEAGDYHLVPTPGAASLGQEGDIARLKRVVELFPDESVVGMGVSRGAATWITMLGSYPDLGKKIKALILESPFASTSDIAVHMAGDIPVISRLIAAIASYILLAEHNLFGIQPIKVIENVPTTIPIMIVHSHEDRLIPMSHARRLYHALKKQRRNNVHLLELKHGPHGNILWAHDGSFYQRSVHTFCKKYGLPYNEDLVDEWKN